MEAFDRIGNRAGPLRFRARLKVSEILASQGRHWSAAANILTEADGEHGDKALFHGAEWIFAASDTPEAFRSWNELLRRYPSSPYAHRAALAVLESGEALADLDEYSMLAMARAAHASGDNSTADKILVSLERRRVDRRIRDDVLLLHGEALFRLSRYQEAFEAFRDARYAAPSDEMQREAWAGMIRSRLYMGETPRAELARQISEHETPQLLEAVETLAALERARGETRDANALLGLTDKPLFEKFLNFYHEGNIQAAWETADRLSGEDKTFAHALLAERAGSPDIWRLVIFQTDHDYFLKRAEGALLNFPPNSAEAATLLASALGSTSMDEATMRRLRVVKYGYPGTESAREADAIMRRHVASRFQKTLADFPVARKLARLGALEEAIDELPDTAMLARMEIFARFGSHSRAIAEAEAMRDGLPWPVALMDLPDSVSVNLYPSVFHPAFCSAADSYRVDPGLLTALSRIQTRFDPSFHSGFRLGIAATDIEALDFAREFADAPKLDGPADLLRREKALAMAAWMIAQLTRATGETLPHRLAAAVSAGPGNLPVEPRASTELEWIAEMPFRNTRRFVLDFIVAYERYAQKEKL